MCPVPACAHACAGVRAPLGTAPCPQRRGCGCEGLHLGSLTVPGVKNPVLLGGALCGPTPRGTRHPREGGHLSSAPCVLCHCVASRLGLDLMTQEPTFGRGHWAPGAGALAPPPRAHGRLPTARRRRNPRNRLWEVAAQPPPAPGSRTGQPPPPAPPPEPGVPPAHGAEGAVGPGSRPFSPTRGREPQPLVGPGPGSGRVPLPTLARVLFAGSTCVGPDKPRRTLAETVWPPKGGMEGSRRSVDSFGLP